MKKKTTPPDPKEIYEENIPENIKKLFLNNEVKKVVHGEGVEDQPPLNEDAYRCMHQNNIRHLAVMENKKLVGILSVKDFANYYHHEVENEAAE